MSRFINNPPLGIFFIVVGMVCISIQDVLIKMLSATYPLHQIILIRSVVGVTVCLGILQFEGGFRKLRTDHFKLHLLRGFLLFLANMFFFCALAAMPLAEATTLFFVAPLFITVLSATFLGEKVGVRRTLALAVGFSGIVLTAWPHITYNTYQISGLTIALPLVAALAYAAMNVLTRSLGVTESASVLAIYVQGLLMFISLCFWVLVGDGDYSQNFDSKSAQFLLRAWVYPAYGDIKFFIGCGVTSAFIGYSISQAYRVSSPVILAPFEYIALPLAIMWGWLIWGDFPTKWTWFGILLIVGAGIYVFAREKKLGRSFSPKRLLPRW